VNILYFVLYGMHHRRNQEFCCGGPLITS